MDVVHDWAAYLFHSQDPFLWYINPYASQLLKITSTLKAWLYPLVQQATQKPDLATIALLLIIVLVLLKILNMLWQAFMFWVRLARRVVFLGGLAALAIWMYTRGPDGMLSDIQYWAEVWTTERKYWTEQEKTVRMARQKPAYGRQGTGWF